MPELPEVETIRRELAGKIAGKIIQRVEIPPDPKGCRHLRRAGAALPSLLAGRTIESVGRRAKYLLAHLDGGDILILHLGMSGQLLYRRKPEQPPRHARMIFLLQPEGILYFNDPRKFGEAYLYSPQLGLTEVDPFSLGVEPLGKDFTPVALGKALAGRAAPIKAVLLDQTLVAGLGNIYTDEALFRSAIHPLRPAGSLSREEIHRLRLEIRAVLREAIRLHGTSAADRQYVDAEGELGRFQSRLGVYQRAGEACPVCRTAVATLKIAGRTAHYCPACQTLP